MDLPQGYTMKMQVFTLVSTKDLFLEIESPRIAEELLAGVTWDTFSRVKSAGTNTPHTLPLDSYFATATMK